MSLAVGDGRKLAERAGLVNHPPAPSGETHVGGETAGRPPEQLGALPHVYMIRNFGDLMRR